MLDKYSHYKQKKRFTYMYISIFDFKFEKNLNFDLYFD